MMKLKKPLFWDYKKQNLISYILIPFTLPFIIRNFVIKFLKKKNSSHIKTICVGNIYVGGTGKTPLTIKIYEILKQLNYKVATVKKFYSKQIDEQIILKEKTELILSKSRSIAINEGLNKKYDILIFDDGLQDSKLDFDKKIVCFKSKNWIGNGQLIPAGPLRQKISSLKNFDIVIFNGYTPNIKEFETKIKKINSKIKFFNSYYKINNLKNFDLTSNFLIFSGIGNPDDFKNLLIDQYFKISKEIIFPDHYNYTVKDFEKILKLAKDENLKIVTTEKDYVKIPHNLKYEFDYIQIDLIIKNEKDLINALIN